MADKSGTVSKTLVLRYPVKYTDVYNTILESLDSGSYTDEDRFALELVLDEALTNAVKRGNKNDPNKKVVVEFTASAEKLDVRITDEGEGFDIRKISDPTCDEGIVRDRGRGIFLVGQLADDVKYEDSGSRVRMIRYLGSARRRKNVRPPENR